MAAGYRSTLGTGLGGISALSPPPPPQAGYCSFSGFWMGGICAAATVERVFLTAASLYWGPLETVLEQAGYRSFLAIWLGGASGD